MAQNSYYHFNKIRWTLLRLFRNFFSPNALKIHHILHFITGTGRLNTKSSDTRGRYVTSILFHHLHGSNLQNSCMVHWFFMRTIRITEDGTRERADADGMSQENGENGCELMGNIAFINISQHGTFFVALFSFRFLSVGSRRAVNENDVISSAMVRQRWTVAERNVRVMYWLVINLVIFLIALRVRIFVKVETKMLTSSGIPMKCIFKIGSNFETRFRLGLIVEKLSERKYFEE